MRLLVVLNHFSPDRGGGGATYSDMCYGLVERGVDVTVYCPIPFYPEWKDKAGRNGWRLWRYQERGVEVVRYGFFIPKNPRSLPQRLWFEATLLFSLLRLVPSARQYDMIMVYCPYFSAVVAAALMKLVARRPVWLNVQDVASQAAISTGLVRAGWLGGLARTIERFFFNRADVWSSISPVMISMLKGVRRRGQPILLLPNWTDRSLEAELAATAPAPRIGVTRLLYAGNIGGKQDLLSFCKALHASSVPFEFRIFGSGGAADELNAWMETAGDDRFSFGPFLAAPALARELKWADLYVITERGDSGASFFPSKYVTSLAAGTPVLAVCDAQGPLGMEMAAFKAGPRFSWDQLDDVGRLIAEAGNDRALLAGWASAARVRHQGFARDPLLDDLTSRLDALANGRALTIRSEAGEVPNA